MKVPVYSAEGRQTAELEVTEAVLGGQVNKEVLRQAVLAYEANQRAGTHKVKTRGEIVHPDRKPWAQKHTGRARAGTRNSPVWVGGGVAHGPKPRDYSGKVNRRMRRQAARAAVLAKMLDGEVKVIEPLGLAEPRTRQMAALLAELGVERTFLLVLARHDPTVWLSARNIRGSAVTTVAELNAYEVLKARTVIFTRPALEALLAAPEGGEPQVAGQSGEQAAEDK